MENYRAIADRLAAGIAAGRLRPGDQLLPQRELAEQLGIANSTASRVYRELLKRELVVGEVGRGTFVRRMKAAPRAALLEPARAAIDLELNFPIVSGQGALMLPDLRAALRGSLQLESMLQTVGAGGNEKAREVAARFLSTPFWTVAPEQVLFTSNGKQALASALAALVRPGQRLGVEALTYPAVKTLAHLLGIELVPLAMDAHGVRPDVLQQIHRRTPLRAVYVQPVLHNPLGTTMSRARLAELAAVLDRLEIDAIEDRVYAFLGDAQGPLASFLPDRCVAIDSLSKRLAPGLTLGFVVAPTPSVERFASAVRAGAWLASGFALEVGTRWMSSRAAARIVERKRRDARARQALVRRRLAEFEVRAAAGAYHCWWKLPDAWRAETFVAAAAIRGIALTPASAFTLSPAHAPNAVRLALATPSLTALDRALRTLGAMAREGPTWQTE